MRYLLLTLIMIFTVACNPAPPVTIQATQTVVATLKPTTTNQATQTAPSAIPTVTPVDYIIRIHPDGGLYVGDLVSFEIEAPNGAPNSQIEIQINPPEGPVFGPQTFHPSGLVGEYSAIFYWVWDTTELEPGQHIIQFSILDGGKQWQQPVTLFAQDELPPQALETVWVSQASQCCILNFLSNTASERELSAIMAEVDAQAESVAEIFNYDISRSTRVVLMPRVIGHGGFAGQEIYISYLDRNYAGNSLAQVLHHEFVHIVDRQMGGDFRPTMLTEGYAVYYSGGHFKPEPLIPRAATLLELNWFIPLTRLANDFYTQQHEIGYLEAAALIEYMIAEWGENAFEAFYRDIQPPGFRSHANAINRALLAHFELTLVELNALFFTHLRNYPVDPMLKSDVENTVAFYDTVRRYQKLLDTSAFYLDAWFLNIDEMINNDITADYYRHPESPANITLEVMLVAAFDYLADKNFSQAESLLAAVNDTLDKLESGNSNPFFGHHLASKYFQVTWLLLDYGYSPQQISFSGDTADALVLNKRLALVELTLVFENAEWKIE